MATSSLYIKDPIDRKITIDGIEYSWPQVPNDQGKGVDFEGPEQEALQMMLSDSVFADAHKRNNDSANQIRSLCKARGRQQVWTQRGFAGGNVQRSRVSNAVARRQKV